MVSASDSKNMDFKSTIVGLEVTTTGVDRVKASYKIDEIGASFPKRLELIMVEVGTSSVSSEIKIVEEFTMRYTC